MTLQVSNAHKAAIAQLFVTLYAGGVIRVMSGSQPATADAAQTGTLLGVVTLNGTPNAGLTFAADGPFVGKPLGVQWRLTAVTSGNAGWWRLVSSPGDDGGASYSSRRVDGAIGTTPSSGAELILPSLGLVAGQQYPLESFLFTIPPIIGA